MFSSAAAADRLAWAPLVAAAFHIIEEFFVPGGFPEWDRKYRPQFAATITPRFHIIINGLLLILAYDAGTMRGSRWGVALWLTVAALLAANAVWHLIGAYRTRSYSPGMVTGTFLYLPLAVCGYWAYVGAGRASVATALVAALLGASYHFGGSKLLHRLRGRKKQA